MINYGLLFLTMTTCLRPELFLETANSIVKYCKDCPPPSRWLIVDDSFSNETTRNIMVDAYPKANWILKTENEKGHDKSMNIIRSWILNNTRNKYVLHWEDDWKLLHPDYYVNNMTDILDENPLYGQVLINENYRESIFGHPSGNPIIGGIEKDDHFVHFYDPEYNLVDDFGSPALSNGHWPHYSLRPGLLRTSVWRHVGEYKIGHQEFEKEYGIRYMNLGFKTAFLKGVHAEHIGRKTWEHEKKSAYNLNNNSRYWD